MTIILILAYLFLKQILCDKVLLTPSDVSKQPCIMNKECFAFTSIFDALDYSFNVTSNIDIEIYYSSIYIKKKMQRNI